MAISKDAVLDSSFRHDPGTRFRGTDIPSLSGACLRHLHRRRVKVFFSVTVPAAERGTPNWNRFARRGRERVGCVRWMGVAALLSVALTVSNEKARDGYPLSRPGRLSLSLSANLLLRHPRSILYQGAGTRFVPSLSSRSSRSLSLYAGWAIHHAVNLRCLSRLYL